MYTSSSSRSRLLKRFSFVSFCTLAITWIFAFPLARAQSHGVYPVAVCSDYDAATDALTFLLYGQNTTGVDAIVPSGIRNNFYPGSANKGQDTYFYPGRGNSFAIFFNTSSYHVLTWSLDGHSIDLSRTSAPPCSPSLFKSAPDLSYFGPGTYPNQYLGQVLGSSSPATLTAVANTSAVSLANLVSSQTPPNSSVTASSNSFFVYGDITVSPGPATSTGLLVGVSRADPASTTGLLQTALGYDTIHTGASAPSTAGCPSDVTAALTPRIGAASQLLGTSIYTQLVMVQNTSGKDITGPIQVALNNLSANARLFNATGTGSCPGYATAPYITVTTDVKANAYAAVVLTCTNSAVPSSAITYTPVFLAGGSRL